eukprot:UN24410
MSRQIGCMRGVRRLHSSTKTPSPQLLSISVNAWNNYLPDRFKNRVKSNKNRLPILIALGCGVAGYYSYYHDENPITQRPRLLSADETIITSEIENFIDKENQNQFFEFDNPRLKRINDLLHKKFPENIQRLCRNSNINNEKKQHTNMIILYNDESALSRIKILLKEQREEENKSLKIMNYQRII